MTHPPIHDPNVGGRGGPTQHASWSLAGNLDSRSDSIRDEFPGITIWSIGDQSHQNSQSDHNPDSREVVHAIDVMTYDDMDKGAAVRDWALRDTADLEYIIFNRKIYSRSRGFDARDYTGSDPHTDHVHLSGKHGETGYCSATGTGYDTAAEAMRPEGMSDDMNADQTNQLTDCLSILTAMGNGADTAKVHDKDGVLNLSQFYDKVADAVVAKSQGQAEDQQ